MTHYIPSAKLSGKRRGAAALGNICSMSLYSFKRSCSEPKSTNRLILYFSDVTKTDQN